MIHVSTTWRGAELTFADTNNLVTLLTRTYGDADVLEKLVVVKADKYTWWGPFLSPAFECP